MKNSLDTHTLNRRSFMRQAACAALGATAMVNTLSCLRLTSAALAQGSSISDDYRALVCIFLSGGNDSNNLLIPGGTATDNPIRADYEQGRGALAISDVSNSLIVPSSTGAFTKHYGDYVPPLASHPNAPEIAELFNTDELSFVCNVGTLAEPIITRADYIDGRVALPTDLFSHSEQRMSWQTSVADSFSATGWGGRVADIMHAAENGDNSKVAMSISIAGTSTFLRSGTSEAAPFTIGSKGVQPLSGFGSRSKPYKNAYEDGSTYENPIYKANREGARLQMVEKLIRLSRENLMAQSYADTISSSRRLSEVVGAAVTVAEATGIDFEQHFANSATKLGDQLKMVAQLIAGRETLGNRRQIFFVSVGGYDVHKEHLESHAALMAELSTGLMAFRNTLKAMGDWDKVVSFTASDFNRTLSANGVDDTAGTDHAWGGHSIVMGGPVNGGELFGHFPTLKVGDHEESIDAHKGRGRWIPAISVDQYSSVMAQWLGVESSAMDEIFPNLHRFDNPLTSSTPNLKFLDVG